MKKIFLLPLLSAIIINTVPALPFSIGAMVGAETTSLEKYVIDAAVEGSVGDFSFGLNAAEDRFADISLYWHFQDHPTFRANVGTAIHERWDSGGLWTVTGDFGQHFSYPSGWLFDWALGVQFGFSWSHYAKDFYPITLSPYLVFRTGWENDYFRWTAYFTGEKPYEKTGQSLPIVGMDFSFEIFENNYLTLDLWYKVADYMRQPVRIISDTGLSLAYTWRGGEHAERT